ncbi:MAG: Ig-like domain-containing protein [Lentilactobacillus hilgardii]
MKSIRILVIGLFSLVLGISLGTLGNTSNAGSAYAAVVKKIHGHRISKPRLTFKYSSVVENTSFNPTKGVTYYYTSPDKVKISFKSYVNVNKPGKYAVVYHIKDRAGYNFYVTHYVNVRKVYLKRVYNPNEITDSNGGKAYRVSTLGTPFKLTAELNIHGASQSGITWASSDPQVASVSDEGQVTPKKDGVTMISVKFNNQTINIPVLVSEGSNINIASSDNIWSQIDYSDLSGLYYKQKGTLKQVIKGLWMTNGEKFIYMKQQFKDPDDESEETDSGDGNEHEITSYANYSLDDAFTKSGNHIILQTQDELGNSHLYVGKLS